MSRKIQWIKFNYVINPNQMDEELDEEEYSTPWEERERKSVHKMNLPFHIRPEGLVPINEQTEFNFWIGHTNFDITESIIARIIPVVGVEDVKPLTRYRFRLAVGKCFKEDKIKNHIYDLCCKDLPDQVLKLGAVLASTHRDWGICKNPEGQLRAIFNLTDKLDTEELIYSSIGFNAEEFSI